MEIKYSPAFERAYKKLPDDIKSKAKIAEALFRENVFDTRLKTHKLTGKLKNYWAFSIDYGYRIIFSFIAKNKVKFHAIGPHNIYGRFS